MTKHPVGMLVGAANDRNKGRSGIGGAIKGTMIDGVNKLVAPPAVTFKVGWPFNMSLDTDCGPLAETTTSGGADRYG